MDRDSLADSLQMAVDMQTSSVAIESRPDSQEHQHHSPPHYPVPVPQYVFQQFHSRVIDSIHSSQFSTALQLSAWQHWPGSEHVMASAQVAEAPSTGYPVNSCPGSESGSRPRVFSYERSPAHPNLQSRDDHAWCQQHSCMPVAPSQPTHPPPQGIIYYRSESTLNVTGQDYPSQAGPMMPNASPVILPSSGSPTIQLPSASTVSSQCPTDFITGVPTAPQSNANVPQNQGFKQLWESENAKLVHFWYSQSQQIPPFSHSNQFLQPHRCHQQQQSIHDGVSFVDACLLRCPHMSCHYWSSSFPIVTVGQVSHCSQENNVPPAVPSAAHLWGVDGSPLHLFPFHSAGATQALHTPFPSSSSASGNLSALFNSHQGSSSSALDSSQLSAQSAFGYMKGQPKVGNCMLVKQKQPTQDLAPNSVTSKQQLHTHTVKWDEMEDKSIHSRQQCLAEMKISNSGEPMAGVMPTIAIQSMESILNSMTTGQYPREKKSLGLQRRSAHVSHLLPSCGQENPAFTAEGRTSLQRPSGKGQWGLAEDRLLSKVLKTYGTRRWSLVSTFMTNRSGKQCRERWVNHLQPNIRKEGWTAEEEQLLVHAHSTFGNRWSAIAKMLPGRTDSCIKNHWHAALRKKGRHGPLQPSLLREYIQQTVARMRVSAANVVSCLTQNSETPNLQQPQNSTNVKPNAGDEPSSGF